MKITSINSRLDIILPLVADKVVLDIGCIDHDASQKDIEPNWLHREVCKSANTTLGLDIEKSAVDKLASDGFAIKCGDIENVDIGSKFDVVVAGEIIEHLKNPGKCLQNIHRHLKDDGSFVLTTPNPFFVGQFFKILKRNSIKVRPDHVAWYDPKTLTSLLKMTGYTVKGCYWVKPKKNRILQSLLSMLRPYLSPTFLIVAHKQN